MQAVESTSLGLAAAAYEYYPELGALELLGEITGCGQPELDLGSEGPRHWAWWTVAGRHAPDGDAA